MSNQSVVTTWEVWTYDVWGNAREGYDVNDRYCISREHTIVCKVETFNVGTAHEFTSATPSDKQLRAALGVGCKLSTSGDDTTIYVNRERDDYPLGELICVSHASLSPIRENSLKQA